MSTDELCERLLGAAITVHRALGPGLLESAYQKCLALELRALGVAFESEVAIPIIYRGYRGYRVEPAYRADLVLDRAIIVEVKSVARVELIHRAQLLTYLRLTGLSVGYILNFNAPVMKEGIARMRL